MEALTDPSDVLVPAAVSPLVAGAVAGAVRPCTVLAAFPTCLYLGLGAHADVLAVLASDALALPIGLRLAEPSTTVRWGVGPGDTVHVGAGRVRLPHSELVASRLARPSRVRPGVRRVGAAGLLPEPGVLGQLVRELVADALAGRPVGPAVRGLVGAGRGLTPSGDDALCGALLALVASGGSGPASAAGLQHRPDAGRALSMVRTAVRSALGRTTSLSAALLVAAGEGYATPEAARLVASLQVGPTVAARSQAPSAAVVAAVSDLLGPVLSIGHSSGHDLVSGLAGALLALDEAEPADSQSLSNHRHRTDPTEKGSRSA
ncbi:DUF2877 domain-containing protein [Intrasporangium sp. YIM S08009]|uniref:oxamate carbamoyltransferase subunit AllH family protein n=1 Tax=Intrasporangium zincisolvens TaxID=3080018 RepID=UPI002B051D54|nr:DUF2877 domain-containing protein [Intrasporangium sp. YIM S08009]